MRVLGSCTRHDREQNATCVTIERDLLPNMVGQHRLSHSFFTGCPRLATVQQEKKCLSFLGAARSERKFPPRIAGSVIRCHETGGPRSPCHGIRVYVFQRAVRHACVGNIWNSRMPSVFHRTTTGYCKSSPCSNRRDWLDGAESTDFWPYPVGIVSKSKWLSCCFAASRIERGF